MPLGRMPRRGFVTGTLGIVTGACTPEPAPVPPEPRAPALPPVEPTPSVSIAPSAAPAFVPSEQARPRIPLGVQSGDVTTDRGIVWAKSDRLARMQVEWDTDPSFASPRRVTGPVATEATDFTARVDLDGLPPGQRVHYRVVFEVPEDARTKSEPTIGSFVTAANEPADVTLAWSGDCAGQGWGINLEWGGMKIFEAMRKASPDLFLHCGDQIYADDPIHAEVPLVDGTVWRNVTTPEKSKVAETLAEFRGAFAYNLLDANVRRFNGEVAICAEWDDHEVHNNWYPGELLEDGRYREKRVDVLAARAKQATLEYAPVRLDERDPARVYRVVRRGPMVDVFMLDERTYRGPNSENRQRVKSAATAFLGEAQLAWLERSLVESRAVWKVLVSDMPLGLVVGDGLKDGVLMQEAWANGKGPPLGRELELAELLRFIKQNAVKNVVFVTADVHYAAAHFYDPRRARFTDFEPFWEFVAGPLHASTFGPNTLDPTFGPKVMYASPRSQNHRRGPWFGQQYFGLMKVSAKTRAMTVSLHDLTGAKLYGVELPAR